MLFNSYEFIFAYLSIVLVVFFQVGRKSKHIAALWLAAASLFFYGWWDERYVLLLIASILFNYSAGYLIARFNPSRLSKALLLCSIAINLFLLGIFKYTNFFITTANSFGANFVQLDIILPLGISFFTFTQIAFIVDVYRRIAKEYNFVHYLLFVTWFPHLIAGPVIHHKQMMPQFARAETYRPNIESICIGLTLFSLGLFKKVMLADSFAPYANQVFGLAEAGVGPMLFVAWAGVISFALQIYFDFSGYSDMAIGLSRIFNVKLPLNFDSPYKATSIIDFWRRWHMTLSQFLRDYLYVPLGGNRKGPLRRYINLLATMLLGGLWHGASWNFVLWGGLHGVYLTINHACSWLTHGKGAFRNSFTNAIGVILTFTCVLAAWVPFRADSLSSAMAIWQGMAAMNGISLPQSLEPWLGEFFSADVQFSGAFVGLDVEPSELLAWMLVGLAVVWGLPNTQRWLANHAPAWDEISMNRSYLAWAPTKLMGGAMGICFAVSVLSFQKNSPFLYFQF